MEGVIVVPVSGKEDRAGHESFKPAFKNEANQRSAQHSSRLAQKWEEAVRIFRKKFQAISTAQLQERVDFATKDTLFPVVAEWRINFGLADRPVSLDVEALARDLGFCPTFSARLLSVVRPDTASHLAYIARKSAALGELRVTLAKHNLELGIMTGYSDTQKRLCRLLVVLRGTGEVSHERYQQNGLLCPNPVLLGGCDLR